MAARIPDPTKPFVVADSVAEIMAEAGINLGKTRLAAGRSVKVRCPSCGGGKTREDSLSVKLDDDGRGLAWHCFRATCQGGKLIPGSGRIAEAQANREQRDGRDDMPTQRVVVQPRVEPIEDRRRPPGLLAWFRKRGISEETVEALGVYGAMKRWPAVDAEGKEIRDEEGQRTFKDKPTVVFPYGLKGQVVNRKFRSPDKQFAQDKGAERTLWNVDSVTSDDEILLVEGEMDVLALWEAGYRQVVTLPDGSPAKLLAEDDPKRATDLRFEALTTCAEVLAPVKKVLIATDSDLGGRNLAEEFARRLGRVRAFRVDWPAGCKDANEVLLRHMPPAERGQRDPNEAELQAGRADLRAAVENASLWPLEGLFSPESGSLAAFLRGGRYPSGLECGVPALDDVLRLPAGPGWLTVVAGIPSHGKSSFLRCWLVLLAMKHGVGIAWYSPEDNRPETLALGIAHVWIKQPLMDAGSYAPDSLLEKAEDWIRRNVIIISQDNPDVDPTLDWWMRRVEEAKRRLPHIGIAAIDPWNEIEHSYDQRKETETQYLGRSLRRVKAWGRSEGINSVIAAHPTKMAKDPRGQYPVPDLYDLSGGANWNNRADLGISVYRQEDTGLMQVRCLKAKYPGFGQRLADAVMPYDKRTARFG